MLKRFKLELRYDMDAESPRAWDTLGTIVSYNEDYADEIMQNVDDYKSWDEWAENELKDSIFLPVYKYEHSGIVLNTTGFQYLGIHGKFDSCQLGFIYVSKEKILEEYGDLKEKTLEKVYVVLEREIELLSEWANGDIYGFSLLKLNEDALKDFMDDNKLTIDEVEEYDIEDFYEEIDCCYGFYGSNWEENGILDEVLQYVDLEDLEDLEVVEKY